MEQNAEMAMMTLSVGAVLWIIMMIIAVKNEFKTKKIKLFWVIGMVVCPPLAIFFPFIGMKQLK